MKLKITFKDPDGVYNDITEAAKASAGTVKGLSGREREELIESRREELEEALKPWIEYGEYLTVEFDTEVATATVQKV